MQQAVARGMQAAGENGGEGALGMGFMGMGYYRLRWRRCFRRARRRNLPGSFYVDGTIQLIGGWRSERNPDVPEQSIYSFE